MSRHTPGHNPPGQARRGSFIQKDAEVTPSEMAVQLRPPPATNNGGKLRSIIKGIEVRPVLPSVIKPLITDRHYLYSMPAAPRRCFGVYLQDELVGAVVFTSGPRHGYRMLTASKPQDVSVLARLWLSDSLPKNSESRVIGIVLRRLRRETDWKLIISYADPMAGHSGTIYRASGWLYPRLTSPGMTGMARPTSAVIVSGRRIHSRTCGDQYGSGSIRHLRATGVPAIREVEPGKHKYVFLLDPSWRWRLKATPNPYPKEVSNAA
ncbi:MAG: DNA methyltransferase [Armatimonadetes bacterium]|nr:DNA methyltransferase [Armatimonadota bacterium]